MSGSDRDFIPFSGVGHILSGGTESQSQREKKELNDFFADETPLRIPQNRPFRPFGGEGRVLGTGQVVPPSPTGVVGYGTFQAPSPSSPRTNVHTLSSIDNSSETKRIKKIRGNIHGFSDSD